MSYTWNEVHAALIRSTSTLDFQRRFEAVRKPCATLSRFRDRAQLLDYLHHSADAPEQKNTMLFSLLCAARSGASSSDCGLTLILLALWPGLDGVYNRTRARRLLPRDELASEVLSRAINAIHTLDPARVRWIAATILKNIERDIMRAHRREMERQRRELNIDTAVLPTKAFPSTFDQSREHLEHEMVVLIGGDAALVLFVALDGFSQSEAAAEFGLSAAAARKRYQRSTARLRSLLQDAS